MKERQLVFNHQWWTMIRLLDRDDRIQLLDNLMQNYFDEKEPELMSDDAAAVWSQIQKAMKQRQHCRNVYKKRSGNYKSQCEEETRNQEETSSSLDSLSKEEKKKKEEEKKAHERTFEEAFCQHYPRLSKLDYPLTFDQYVKLLNDWPYSLVCDVLRRMESYQRISRYRHVNLVLLNWLRRDRRLLQESHLWNTYQEELNKQKAHSNS